MVAERMPAIGRGRPSNVQLGDRLERAREANAILRTEQRTLLDELGRLGAELSNLGSHLNLGYRADRPEITLHVAGRLSALGQSCIRRAAREL